IATAWRRNGINPGIHINGEDRNLRFRQEKIKRDVLRVLQFDILAKGKIDPFFESRAKNGAPQFLMILIVETVACELPSHLIRQGNEEGRDDIEKKVDELIVRNNDQHIRLGSFQIRTQNGESFFC